LDLKASERGPEGFPYLENHVRARLGIPRDEMLLFRQAPGALWRLHKKRVWLAAAGVQAILAAKGLAATLASPDAQTAPTARERGNAAATPKKTAAPAPANAGTTNLLVVRTCVNPHIILCCAEEDDWLRPKKALVRVRVRSSANFRPGMPVPAIRVAGYTDLYDLGRACPKKPGRW